MIIDVNSDYDIIKWKRNGEEWKIAPLEELIDCFDKYTWIPVSERLPEVHESGNSVSGIYMQSNPVLVYGTCEYEDNAQFHVVTYCDDLDGNTYWSTELDAITVSGVIAWMPLPEPYMAESEDKE